ncbi:MAG: hypothetical protein ACOCYE_01595 [Pseudomonadota bacterium]
MADEQPALSELEAAEAALRRQGLDPATFHLPGIVVVARRLEALSGEGALDLGDRDFRAELFAQREAAESGQ